MYLVTGGAGFIGSHIAARLAALGERVRVLDDFSYGGAESLSGLVRRVETVAGNVTNPAVLGRAMAGVNVVFHQAGIRSVSLSMENPALANQVNVEGTLNVLVAARDTGVRRVVFASSYLVYGNAGALPQSEAETPNPTTPYAVSKLAGEHYCKVFAELYGLETVSLRYFDVFGPTLDPKPQSPTVVDRFIGAALAGEPLEIHGDGLQSRDFTYIDNVVDANLLAAENPDAVGEVFNVGQNRSLTLLDLIDRLRRIVGPEIRWTHREARPGDVRHGCADLAKAERILGYRPRVSFEEGLDRTVKNFRRNHAAGAGLNGRPAAAGPPAM